uniref:Uncharacterized protein n=1 Tax=Arundo donax TaxID=35708 RepID=A0A0A9DKV0_ARUDO
MIWTLTGRRRSQYPHNSVIITVSIEPLPSKLRTWSKILSLQSLRLSVLRRNSHTRRHVVAASGGIFQMPPSRRAFFERIE